MTTNQTPEPRQHRRGFLHQLAALPVVAGGSLALRGQPTVSPPPRVPTPMPAEPSSLGPKLPGDGGKSRGGAARRTVLAGIAVAPAALLSRTSLTIAADPDDAVVAKAGDVRRLMFEAEAIYKKYAAIDDLYAEKSRPQPQLDQSRFSQAVRDAFVDRGDRGPASDEELKAVHALKEEMMARHEQEVDDWKTELAALDARLGLSDAEARDRAAGNAVWHAMQELATMPAVTLTGIAAKAGIFCPPCDFEDDDEFHVGLAKSIIRDLNATSQHISRSATVPALPAPLVASDGGSGDPIPAMWAEIQALRSAINAGARDHSLSDDELEQGIQQTNAIDDAATSAHKATTIAGAIASIEWTRYELLEHHLNEIGNRDPGERLILALLDGALGALRGGAA